MTDREREYEIARRLGWTLVHHEYDVSPDSEVVPQPRQIPAYLTDRNAAQEIVQWFRDNNWFPFKTALLHLEMDIYDNITCGLFATPRQICDAACKVWEIE